MGIGVAQRLGDDFGALVSKLLPDFPYVVYFLKYLMFYIYAIAPFAYCCIRGYIFCDLLNVLTCYLSTTDLL